MQVAETTSARAASAWRLAIPVVAICFALNAGVAVYLIVVHPALNSDFLAFYAYPHFAASHPIATLYETAPLRAFEQAFYPGFYSFYAYVYPPTFLLVTWWFNAFPFGAAEVIWTLTGLAALVVAAKAMFPRRNLAVVALVAAPAALISGATGETGFFTTALLLAGFAALPSRQVLAGICFGLLTLKPQLGLLVPVALVAMGSWRAIGVAAVTAAALVGLSCVVFPPSLWLVWAHAAPAYQAQYFAAAHALNMNINVTPVGNLLILGLDTRAALVVQALISLAVAVAVYLVFRRGLYRIGVAALLTGTLLAAPHAYVYDAVALTAALLLAAEQVPGSRPLALVAALVYLSPLMLLCAAAHDFLYAFPESLLYAGIIYIAFARAPVETIVHEHESRRIRT
jgi:hypothetical protein